MDWPLLAPLTDGERSEVLSTALPRRFARGEVVFHEGDPADSLHLVSKGRLAVRSLTPDGDAAMLNLLIPGDFFGELALLHRERIRHRSATVLALEAAETLSLSADAFRRLCETHPRVEHLLTTLLAQRVEELSKQLLEALYVGLDRRVYRRLVELCGVYGTEDGVATIPLTQDQLADLVGGTRPSVNQVLQKLAAQDALVLGRGRIEVRDQAMLQRRAGL
ncbi:MAG TPA: Crp/Fnr family transcriptional regulator [Actinomycetes bacterium]|nr:Crp/Fnr family transcriptional regulator [Actinomycetes bacterium]